MPERRWTLRAAIDWSYNLKAKGSSPSSLALGTFVGGCTLSAAEAICSAELDTATLANRSYPSQSPSFGLSEGGVLEGIRVAARQEFAETEKRGRWRVAFHDVRDSARLLGGAVAFE